MNKDAPDPVDTFTEMTAGVIGTRLLCGALMREDDDPAAIDPFGHNDQLSMLTDGNLSAIETERLQ